MLRRSLLAGALGYLGHAIAMDRRAKWNLGRLKELIPGLLSTWNVPGMQVAAVERGEICYQGAFGVRSAAPREQVTNTTILEAASLSKPVFAFATLELAAQGRLKLDTPLTAYLKSSYIHQQDPFEPNSRSPSDVVSDPQLTSVTARMVLSHTAGFPNWSRDPLRFISAPGTRWSYSSEGYVFLQRVVERIMDQSTETIMRSLVFDPLGMRQSSIVWSPRYESTIATGHNKSGEPQPLSRHEVAVASSTLYTSASDYARFLGAVAWPGSMRLDRISADMCKPNVIADPDLRMHWGLGLGIEDLPQKTFFFHWGSNPGYCSFAIGSRKTGRALVLLTNGQNGLETAEEITNVAFGGPHPIFRSKFLHPDD
jgi:CubicO group peptidase (beta-lactamase class C family)